jgi:integrase
MTTRKPRTRARRGDHSIHFDQARRCYEGSVSLGTAPLTGKRLRPKFRGKTVEEVQGKIQDYLRDREAGVTALENMTLRECVLEYLGTLPAGGTTDGYRSTAGAWLIPDQARARELRKLHVPVISEVRIRDLSVRAHLDPFFAAVAPYRAPRTLQSLLRTLRDSLHRAEVDGLVQKNLAALVRLPKGKAPKPATALPVEEVTRMLEAAKGTPVFALLYLLFTTGPRSGELRGLRWEDVDLDAQTVSYLNNLKNDGSRRRVRISPECAQALRDHRTMQETQRQKVRAYVGTLPLKRTHLLVHDTGLVFTREDGTGYTKDGIGREFKRAAEAAGVTGRHIHEGRHTAVSILDSLGVRGQEISDLVGHANEIVTRRVYRHILTPEIKGGAEVMDGVLGRAAGNQ